MNSKLLVRFLVISSRSLSESTAVMCHGRWDMPYDPDSVTYLVLLSRYLMALKQRNIYLECIVSVCFIQMIPIYKIGIWGLFHGCRLLIIS